VPTAIRKTRNTMKREPRRKIPFTTTDNMPRFLLQISLIP
jgi:hypothetical protein